MSPRKQNAPHPFLAASKKLLIDTLKLYAVLLKVMIPTMLGVRLAVEFGLIELLSDLLGPVMRWVDLPGEMGIAWATAMLVNIYAGAAALLTLLPEHPLTVAQATVLGAMILIAHSLPLEQQVARKAGAGLLFTLWLRLAGALLYGMLLTVIYSGLPEFQQPATIVLLPVAPPEQAWLPWAVGSVRTLLGIFWIILALMVLLKLLDLCRITPLLARLLAPFMRLMGIGTRSTAMTMTGTLLGLSYGGALIINEAKTGNLADKEIFLALCFMCLCHSLIEDTLFVMAFGGHYSGLLIGRFLFALAVMMLLARIVHALPPATFRRYLFHSSKQN